LEIPTVDPRRCQRRSPLKRRFLMLCRSDHIPTDEVRLSTSRPTSDQTAGRSRTSLSRR
jgi:hypothetical protein